jgi:hypothetical protein
MLEVAKPAVNDLEAARRSRASEIVTLDQANPEPVQRPSPRSTDAIDPAADDGEVERL